MTKIRESEPAPFPRPTAHRNPQHSTRIITSLTALQNEEGIPCDRHKFKTIMVILAAAALTAAGVGAYQGGKAVAGDVQKKLRRSKTQRTRNQERKLQTQEQEQLRQIENQRKEQMSVDDRVAKFKRGIPTNSTNQKGLFRK
jgi:uncharacterized protein HemX